MQALNISLYVYWQNKSKIYWNLTEYDIFFYCIIYLLLTWTLISVFLINNLNIENKKKSRTAYKNILDLKMPFMTMKYAALHIELFSSTIAQILEIFQEIDDNKNILKACNCITVLQNLIMHIIFEKARWSRNFKNQKYILFFIKNLIHFFEIESVNLRKYYVKWITIAVKMGVNLILMICMTQDHIFTDKIYFPKLEKSKNRESSFWWLKIQLLKPFLFPNSWKLKLCIAICFISVLAGRIINLFLPRIFNHYINDFNSGNMCNLNKLMSGLCFFLIITFLQGHPGVLNGFLTITKSFFWIPIQQNINHLVSLRVYSHILSLYFDWHVHAKNSDLIRIIERSGRSIDHIINYVIFSVLPPLIDLVVSVLYFANNTNYVFAAIVFITFFSYILCTYIFNKWKEQLRSSMKACEEDNTGIVMDTLMNFSTVKNFLNENLECNRYESSLEALQNNEKSALQKLLLLNFFQNVIVIVGLATGCIVCLNECSKSPTYKNDIILFLNYMNQIYTPLSWVGFYFRIIQNSFLELDNLINILLEDQHNVKRRRTKFSNNFTGKIEFRNVYFKYPLCRKYALKNLSFLIEKGQKFCIVGPSGCGKSTIFKILLKYYNIEKGEILIDGTDIHKIDHKVLLRNISVIPQECGIFNNTIRHNILYGNIRSDSYNLQKSSERAQAHDFIMDLENQYSTVLNRGGLNISGGERKRICIARSLLKSCNVRLIDEATSFLDDTRASEVIKTLIDADTDSTSIFISHRIEIAQRCDFVIFITDGTIQCIRSHNDLISADTNYTKFWNTIKD